MSHDQHHPRQFKRRNSRQDFSKCGGYWWMFQWKRISVNGFRVLLDFRQETSPIHRISATRFWLLSPAKQRSNSVQFGWFRNDPGGHFGGKLWKFWRKTGFYHINHLGGVRVKRSGVECTNFKTQYFISLSHDKKRSRWDDTKWNEHRFVEPDVLTFVLRKWVTKRLLVWLVLVTILFI